MDIKFGNAYGQLGVSPAAVQNGAILAERIAEREATRVQSRAAGGGSSTVAVRVRVWIASYDDDCGLYRHVRREMRTTVCVW